MSEEDYQMLMAGFDRLRRECNTPEKATVQLQSEGLLDADGNLAARYTRTEADTWP